VHFLNGLFHVWNQGRYITSTNGITWTRKYNALPNNNPGYTAIWNGNRYVVNDNSTSNYIGKNSYYALYSTTGSTALN
jgi:hypothetical protein